MPPFTLAFVAVLASLLVACSESDDPAGSGFSPDTTCGLDLSTSGATKLTVSPSDSVACATQLSSGTGIDVGFLLIEGAVEATSLRVNVGKGQTGTGFLAQVGVKPRNADELQAVGCLADITANEDRGPAELGRQYRVVGEVHDDGKSNPGEDSIVIDRLRFVASVTWTD
jgi:hypothetical protein